MRRDRREQLSVARSKRTGRNPSVLEVAFTRVGFRASMRVASFVAAWAIAEEASGEPISCDEYASWWKMSRATAFREQAAFRECFPEFDTPSVLIAACEAAKVEAGLAGLREVAWSW